MTVRSLKFVFASVLFAAFVVARPAPVHAGTIILEGSDAIGFHSNSNAAAGAYKDQVWSAIGGADPRPIAVIGGPVTAGVITSGTHPIQLYSSVAAAEAGSGTGALDGYVALYFLAGGGCCEENDSLITAAGASAAVGSYLTAGGTVMIEDYIGGAAWDFAVGAGGLGNAHVGGVGGGQPGPSCDDGETVTADGLANGFTQPTPMSCWTHQGYDTSFFGPLGFTLSFFQFASGVRRLESAARRTVVQPAFQRSNGRWSLRRARARFAVPLRNGVGDCCCSPEAT